MARYVEMERKGGFNGPGKNLRTILRFESP